MLEPDDVADVIQEAGEEHRATLLALFDAPTRKEVSALLAYADEEAGGLMFAEHDLTAVPVVDREPDRNALFVEHDRYCAQRLVLAHDRFEDPPHHARFVQHHLIVSGCAVGLLDVAVAVRGRSTAR